MENKSEANSVFNTRNQDVVSYTKTIYDSLTKAEKKIADILLSNPEQIMYDTISGVAERAQVGDATVFRFCKRLGFNGFFAFRIALAQYISDQKDQNGKSSPSSQNSIEAIIMKTKQLAAQAIEDTSRTLDPNSVEAAIKLISSKRKIYFFGIGDSNNSAMDAMNKFIRVGLTAIATTDTHMQLMEASLMTPDDLAIGFSLTGSTKGMVQIMKTAKKTGASTICITSHRRSPIIKYSDIILLMCAFEGPYEGGSIEGKVCQSFVINVLLNCITSQNPQMVEETKKKIAKVIEGEIL